MSNHTPGLAIPELITTAVRHEAALDTVHVDDRCRPAPSAEKVFLAFVCSPESVPALTWLTAIRAL